MKTYSAVDKLTVALIVVPLVLQIITAVLTITVALL